MTSTTDDHLSDEHVSTSRGACVFCNTTRPIEQVLCPSCGRGWIDTSAVDSVDTVVKAEAEAIRTITTGEALPVRRSTYRRGWWLPLAIAAVVFGAYWGVVTVLDGEGTTTTTSPVAAPTTLAPTTTAPVLAPPTTLPAPTATTTPPTTTTSTTTTTLPTLAVGEEIPIDELRLGAIELGPLAFGTAADAVLPDLVATFGQPTAIAEATPAWGLCAGDAGRIVTFGGLHIITLNDDGSERFAGFVVEPAGAASDELQTFSGIRLGSSIGDLTDTYRSVSLDVGDEATTWVVASVNDGRTLLRGTAQGAGDDAVIDRIASPSVCDGGPGA